MKVRDIMTGHVESCAPTANLAAAAMIMWRNDCGVVPVVDDQIYLRGVITDRDICMAAATRHASPDDIRVGDTMTREVLAVAPHDGVRRALETMREHRVRRLPVADAEGRLVGILSINDLVLHAGAAHGRGAVELSVQEVHETMAAICGHRRAPAASGEKKELVTAVH